MLENSTLEQRGWLRYGVERRYLVTEYYWEGKNEPQNNVRYRIRSGGHGVHEKVQRNGAVIDNAADIHFPTNRALSLSRDSK